jgi:TPR repeat protein
VKRILFAAFVLGVAFSASAFAQFNGFSNNLVWSDPPGRVFPGKYFEYKAQFYLHKHDYRFALDMFELAGFWANKRAQYNTGIMYFNGIGVPVDKARGAAWLGIAAENHDDLTIAMLQSAYAQLSDSEKQQAQNIWQELDGKYGDATAIPRALHNFGVETGNVTGSHVGFVGNLMIAERGSDNPEAQPASDYYRRQREQRDELISTITGHVTVGAVTTLPVPDAPHH